MPNLLRIRSQSRPSLDEAPFSSAKISAKLVIGLVAVLSTHVTSFSQTCLSARKVRSENVYAFSLALIDSFSYAKDALDRGNSQETPFDLIQSAKFVQRDHACAARSVEPYTASKNEKIQLAAEGAHVV